MPSRCAVRVDRWFSSRGVVGAVLLASAFGSVAHAQVFANAYAYQYADRTDKYGAYSPPGCVAGSGSGATSASGSTTCDVPPVVPGGSGSLVASASSSFDATGGTFRSSASLVANNYKLTQFVPASDAGHTRTFPGDLRPDVVGVYTYVGLTDAFTLHSVPGVSPATVSFFFNVDGSLRADPSPDGGHQIASSFINICAVDCSGVTDNAYSGIAGFNLQDTPGSVFSQSSSAPSGADAPTVTFAGSEAPGAVNGLLTFGGIPVSSGSPFDFVFIFGSQAGIYHSSASYGHLPDGCDPTFDAGCSMGDPVTFDGTTAADFGSTVKFAGYKVLDAAGNDITSSVDLEFRSGLTPAAVTATPEPATLLLVVSGVSVLGFATRRRARNS